MEKLPSEPRKYEAISPTAWGVAYRRTFTNISFTKEIYAELEKIRERQPDIRIESYGLKTRMEISPFFEGRYLILNKLLKEVGAKQILEIAAGLSPRGLEFTADPTVTYAELDLPEMENEKKEILENVMKATNITRPNLHVESGNGLVAEDVMKATTSFKEGEQTAVIHEGLLRYLNHGEKEKLAEAIIPVLQKFNGVWITPDIGIRDNIYRDRWRNEGSARRDQEMAKQTGAGDFHANLFANTEEAKQFFEKFGLNVEERSYEEVMDELVSPQLLNVDEKTTKDLMNWSKVFLMRI